MAFPTNPIYKLYKERVGGKDPDGKVIEPQIIGITKYLGIEGHYIDIPLCNDNTDYQEYLEWAKTNTAEEPD
tara:strand:- start:410 stop:625 length:216 start_codon:yes stop_codon:yes gene_type:complete